MTIGKMTTFEEQCEMPCEENKSNEKCSALNFYVEIETADANDDIKFRIHICCETEAVCDGQSHIFC